MTNAYAYFQSLLADARDRESGQTMAEYAVALAVIVVAIAGTLILLAGVISKSLSSVTARTVGSDAVCTRSR